MAEPVRRGRGFRRSNLWYAAAAAILVIGVAVGWNLVPRMCSGLDNTDCLTIWRGLTIFGSILVSMVLAMVGAFSSVSRDS